MYGGSEGKVRLGGCLLACLLQATSITCSKLSAQTLTRRVLSVLHRDSLLRGFVLFALTAMCHVPLDEP